MKRFVIASLSGLLLSSPVFATVTITGKAYTYTNGQPNDASQIETDLNSFNNNFTNIKSKVDTLLNGQIEDGTSLILNSVYTGSAPGNMSFEVERGTLANTRLRWNESNTYWEATNDGTNYAPLLLSLVNAQTGTTYTLLTTDQNKLVTLSNASPVAVTLPQANSTTFRNGWRFTAKNLGAGVVTITPTTSTINGASTLVLNQNDSATITSDGTNYQITFTPGPATQAQQEAASSTAVYVSPGTQKYHPGMSKSWVRWDGTGTALTASYGTTSLTHGSTGNYTITWSTAYSATTAYACVGSAQNVAGVPVTVSFSNYTTTTVDITVLRTTDSLARDSSLISVACLGDQ